MRYRFAHRFVLLVLFAFGLVTLASTPANAQVITGVSLDTPQVWHVWPGDAPDGIGKTGAPLAIEVSRQTILIAARDELGLRTLDASLGEPSEQPGVLPLSVQIQCIWKDGSRIELTQGDKQLLKTTLETNWRGYKDVVVAIERHEVMSRGAAVESLRAAGLAGKANAWLDQAEVPEEITSLADQQSLIPQFRAARELHALIRAEGESPERLWALSRVYANLGQECRWFIRTQFAVFQARSLLYAKRLHAKAPDHPLSSLAMTYAWTMAGYPKYAQPYQQALDKQVEALGAVGGDAADWVGWATLIRACGMHDRSELNRIALTKTPQASIAALWRVYQNEFIRMNGLTFKSIEEAMQINPLSTRNLYGGYDAMGVSTGHWLTEAAPDHFGLVTGAYLRKIEKGPKAIVDRFAKLPEEALSLRDLAQTGWALEDLAKAGEDPNELSYGVLGTLIGEANALHIAYRAKFMRNQWGVDSTEYLQATIPALSRHPYQPLVYSFALRKRSTNELMKNLMSDFEPEYINVYCVSLFSYHLPDNKGMRFANGWTLDDWWQCVKASGLQSSSDWLYWMRWYNRNNHEKLADQARRMNGYDSHHPKRIALLLFNPKLSEQRVNNLGTTYGSHPLVASALADRMERAGKLNDARSYAEIAAMGSPEYKTVVRLARLELLLGDEAKWLAAMKLTLKLPDHGLYHAKANQIIAHTYMNQERFDEALPYSKASADSWAAWAMNTYIINLAVLGKHDEAKVIGQRVNERYGLGYLSEQQLQIWSGQADAAQMSQWLERYYKQQYGNKPVEYGWRMLYKEMSLGLYEQALTRVERQVAQEITSTRILLFGVVAAQHLGKDEARDKLLKLLIEYPLKDGKRLRFSLLGDLMKRALETERVDWDAADQWTQQHDNEYGVEVAGNLGVFALKLPEERERALAELLFLAKRPEHDLDFANIARTLLRKEGYTNEQMLPTGFSGHAYPQDGLE